MLAVISPAKKLDFETPAKDFPSTECALLNEAEVLIKRCKELSARDRKSVV